RRRRHETNLLNHNKENRSELMHTYRSSFSNAHSACSRTTESGCSRARSSQGANRGSPEFPIATQRFRSQPRNFARLTGEREKIRRKSSSVSEARSSMGGLKREKDDSRTGELTSRG